MWQDYFGGNIFVNFAVQSLCLKVLFVNFLIAMHAYVASAVPRKFYQNFDLRVDIGNSSPLYDSLQDTWC